MKKYIWTILTLHLFLSTIVVRAGGLIYTDLPTLIKNSASIIEGIVTKVEARWDTEHRFIYTYTTISVTKSYIGEKQKEIVLKEIGGVLDGFETISQHKVIYKVGEEVLVFLQEEGSFFRTYGRPQGKFIIERNNNEKQLRRDIDIEKLILLNKDIKREDIKNVFKYSDIITLITNHVGGKNEN